jgi:hypothetical protein
LVVGDGVVEARNAEVNQLAVLGIGIETLHQSIIVLLELRDLDLVVVSTE